MRLLYFEYSYLSGNGGGIYAARSHINMFSALSSSMTLLYPVNKKNGIEGVDKSRINTLWPIEDKRSIIKKVYDRIIGRPTRFYMISEDLFDNTKYDTVVFDNSLVSARLIKIARKKGLKVITIHHNYQVEYIKADGNPYTRFWDIIWTRKYEGEAVRLSDINLVLTPQDAKLLAGNYGKEAKFACLGVCEYKKSDNAVIPNSSERLHRYLITGGLSARQNEVSIISWLKDYYPLLKSIDSQTSLSIAGRSPSERLKSIIVANGVNLIDSPKDMWPVLQSSDYYICPVDCGGGLKLKIMDGLKAGMPVITHKVSARGYEPMKEYGVVFDYDDKESFTKAILNALNLKMSKQEVVKKYNSVFSFEQGLKRLKTILEDNHFL